MYNKVYTIWNIILQCNKMLNVPNTSQRHNIPDAIDMLAELPSVSKWHVAVSDPFGSRIKYLYVKFDYPYQYLFWAETKELYIT